MSEELARLSAALTDHYAVERELGQGGMATVYLARDLRHDRKVAIKVLRPELSAILGAERFLKEIRLTANLQHPHILPLHDSGTADGTVFYVMPYVEGESLRHRMVREKQLPVEEAVRITREVASALDYAHRHGVVHRDIKPENILLHDGQALVADFGIALAVSTAGGGTRMTETGMSLGTPHYMSPEQAMGEREITARSDVYALGCVLYEMLLGEPPFTGPTAQAIIARVVTEEPRPMRVQRRSIPANVEAAVHTALAKLPADRFASAAQFSEALAKTDFSSAATVTAPATRTPAGWRSQALVAAPWILLLIAGSGFAWRWPRQPAADVTRQKITLSGRPTTPGHIAYTHALAPDGSAIAFVDSSAGVQQIWLKEKDALEPTPVTGTTGALAVTFSPDGQWLAFVADRKLKKVPRQGGAAVTVADSANTDIPAIAWLERSNILFNSLGYDLQLVSENGGTQRRLFFVDSMQRGIVSITPLPDGRGALFAACTLGCPEVDLRVVELPSGQVKILTDGVLKAWHTRSGNVVFVRADGGVFAAPFDTRKLEFRSQPMPVLEGVRTGIGTPDMVVSPSGDLLYIPGTAASADAPVSMFWVGRNGQAEPLEADWKFVPVRSWGPALSPDGRRLAVGIKAGANEDIWIKQLNGGPLSRLTFEGVNTRAWWTAGGDSLYYLSRKPGERNLVRRRRADGTGEETIAFDLSRPIFDLSFVPGDSTVVVRFGVPRTRDVALARFGDTAWTPLIASDQHEEVAPIVSPDGRWLAYGSDESGRYEVYVRPFPNVNGGRWQISRSGGSVPLWAHSGRELFFLAANGTLMAVPVSTEAGFSAAEPVPLFSAKGYFITDVLRTFDISRDDRRFLFRQEAAPVAVSSQPPLVYVHNWLAELKAGSGTQ